MADEIVYKTTHGRELTFQEEPATKIEVHGIEADEMVEVVRKYNNMALDLKTALELIRRYQEYLNRLMGPDPSSVEANNLMRKYNVPLAILRQLPFRVIVDGIDITEHPDSIPGTVATVEEIEAPDDEEIVDAEEVKELGPGTD